jgi:hypothetical protein
MHTLTETNELQIYVKGHSVSMDRKIVEQTQMKEARE